MRKITAVIPVRKGSVRVKNKNLKPFANTNLLELKINQLKQVKLVDDIVVSSDCDTMLSIAESHGIKTHKEMTILPVLKQQTLSFSKPCRVIDAEYIMYARLRVL